MKNILQSLMVLSLLLTGASESQTNEAALSGQALEITGTRLGDDTGKDGSGRRAYIIELKDPPLASYRGGISGLAPTHAATIGTRRFDPLSPASLLYNRYLATQQETVLANATTLLGRSFVAEQKFKIVFNGIAVRLNDSEAAAIRDFESVTHVHRDVRRSLHTDSGPSFIGAPGIWDGSSTPGLSGTMGEGIIVGILDTGINPDHPSFSDIGDDAFDHNNPLGAGIYKGVCDSADPSYDPAFQCNDKLIGAWNFNGNGPRDDDGHGSHTASTAAGNILFSIDLDAPTTSFTFDISGVAPHANIIAYDVCESGCASSDSIAAIDQAVLDGVSVINYSIGGGGEPYDDSVSLAFLGARDAGIVVCASAGNEGPNEESVAHREPWTLTVGASTHDRALHSLVINMSGGDTSAPVDITGKSVTSDLEPAEIVYAGDYGDALCNSPFAPGTFSGQIVVCDRGIGGRIAKGSHILAGGAAGYILANDDDNNNSTNADGHVLPAVHITYADGQILKQWLSSGAGHSASIAATTVKNDPIHGDIMASFSSRGPSFGIATLKPDILGPGVDIIAAGDGNSGSNPDELEVMAGTSMAAPHLTGAAALIKALKPTWTPGQIQSALITTASSLNVVKEDSLTPADPFDMGGGRIDLSVAGQTALLIDETRANFEAADPGTGGDPRSLNVPSMISNVCHGQCSFHRTLTNGSTSALSWTSNSEFNDPAFVISVVPASLTLSPGASASFDVFIDTSRVELDTWHFGAVIWNETTGVSPPTRMPIAIRTGGSNNDAMLTKKVSPASAGPGDTLTYILTAINGGYTSQSFNLVDPLPANTTYVNSSVTGGLGYDGASDSVSWTGTLAPTGLSIGTSPSPYGYVSLSSLGFDPYPCFDTGCDEFAIIVGLESFHFWHSGARYNTISVVTNGYVIPGIIENEDIDYQNQDFPDLTRPNNAIAPLWTDLDLDDPGITDDGQGTWYGAIIEDGSTRYLVIEWEHAQVWDSPGSLFTFQVWIQEDTSNIWFVYNELSASLPPLTIGVEDKDGTAGAVAYYNGAGALPTIGTDFLVSTTEGESRVFSFQATVDADSNEPIVNEATLNWNGQSATAWISTLLPSSLDADLSLSITAAPDQHLLAPYSYTITTTNSGPIGASNVVVSDHLPSGLQYVSDTCNGGFVSGSWQWAIGNLGVGVSAECQLRVVANFLGSISNTASVASSQNDPLPANNSDNAGVTVSIDVDSIFSDGFETGGLSNWSEVVP